MTNEVIPEVAVEAAMNAARPLIYENVEMPYAAHARDYDNLADLRVADAAAEVANDKVFRAILRAALEAAAPHLLDEAKADAWDEGWRGGYDTHSAKFSLNPYRQKRAK